MRPSVFTSRARARRELIDLLRLAHAGELAAALAYRGHWRSLRKESERREVRTIEREELAHRDEVGAMLTSLGGRPSREREGRMRVLGTVIGMLCNVGGWLAPMYGAGRLESSNVREYEDAARFALVCGRADLAPSLLGMAEAEWDHERYFRSKVESHWLGKRLPLWSAPGRRALIRESFDAFAVVASAVARAVRPTAASRRDPELETAFERSPRHPLLRPAPRSHDGRSRSSERPGLQDAPREVREGSPRRSSSASTYRGEPHRYRERAS